MSAGIPFHERSGVLSGGNWIVDRVKIVDRYPERERLADVFSESLHFGGSACNLLTDLALLRAPFPLAGVGLVGEDEDGERILAHCRNHGIEARGIRKVQGARTSSTDVITERPSGKRTFFHSRGANARLDRGHFQLEHSRARIFHLGYLLLLDQLDRFGPDGRTDAYHLLARARELGFKTSVDVVSSESGRFAETVISALRAVDFLFLNEYEAEMTTGVPLRGRTEDRDALRNVLEELLALGVREWAVLHFPGGSAALSVHGDFLHRGSVKLPPSHIMGAVGAGDAFAAGALYGIHEGCSMGESLDMGACAAAACLMRPGSSEGIVPMRECLELGSRFGFRALPVESIKEEKSK